MIRSTWILLYLTTAFTSFLACADLQQTDNRLADIHIIGPEELMLNHDREACEVWDIPDIPARAFRDTQGQTQLIASTIITRRMIGTDLSHLKQDCRVLMSSKLDPDPGNFKDHEWISSTYTLDGHTIYALVHNEYHGWEHDPACTSKATIDCWYNAVTLAISKDGGNSYYQANSPAHYVAGIPFRYAPNSGPVGIFNPSNIIHNDNDDYYYVFFTGRIPNQAVPGRTIGIMRTQNLSDATSWRAWDGKHFNSRFVNPYTEIMMMPGNNYSPLSEQALGDMSPFSITWNTFLKRYLMIGTSHVIHPSSGKAVWAITYSFSEDLIHWTQRQFLKKITQPAKFKKGDPDPTAYPSALDPNSISRNFESTGKQFYIYYTHLNYNGLKKKFLKADRDLARIPVELEFVSASVH